MAFAILNAGVIGVQPDSLDHAGCVSVHRAIAKDAGDHTAMKSLAAAVLALNLAAPSTVVADAKSDEAAIRNLPNAFCAAWNRHDGHALAQVMADDVDFVTVGAMWLHGRPDFEKYHTRLLSGRFGQSRITSLQTAVRFLRPDVAIVHWSWKIAGDKNVDLTPRQPRYGMMTMLVEKRNGSWLVVASQNDNADPWSPAEGPMPNLAMPIPGPSQESR
jgi:uncharacterized protein (TIGR02246 family)